MHWSLEDVVAAAGWSELGADVVAIVSSLSCECMLFMKAMDFCCGSSIASLSLLSAKQYASCIYIYIYTIG